MDDFSKDRKMVERCYFFDKKNDVFKICFDIIRKNEFKDGGEYSSCNPNPEHIPCHRVVNAQGKLALSYAFGGIESQRRLLVSEGVVFKNDQAVDLSVSQMILKKF